MSAGSQFTMRPFTVAVCAPCAGKLSSALMAGLRDVIGNCPHGVLIQTQCLLGELTCTRMRPARGQVLLLQPCNTQRVPTAAVHWIGPVRTQADVESACAWIAGGKWDRDDLAGHLHMDRNMAAIARSN
ncbi:MAG: hypothetical protein K0R33_2590 [Mycobacterium sp.]|jgi:hypothetical protein|nr:hypothetical protein [Mycobacterium sp.]